MVSWLRLLAPTVMLVALLFERSTNFDPSGPQGGDRTEMPDASSGAWGLVGGGDLTLPEIASALAAPHEEDSPHAREPRPAGSGRLYVDDIFRPPIPVLA